MIQFNLLPDIKLEYIKTRRVKRVVMTSASLVTGGSLLVLFLLFAAVNGIQKRHMDALTRDIAKGSQTLRDIPDLNKVLTIQSQLGSLPGLHDAKPVATRLFGYIAQTTPSNLKMNSLDLDFTALTMKVTGEADTLNTVNQFVDTLKFTTYKTEAEGSEAVPAFSAVVLSSFGRGEKNATYEVTFNFDPIIFNNDNAVALTVPKIITTRSQTEKPGDLFQLPTTVPAPGTSGQPAQAAPQLQRGGN